MRGVNGVSRRVKALRILMLASLLPLLMGQFIGPIFGPADFGMFFGGGDLPPMVPTEVLREFSNPGREAAERLTAQPTPRSEAEAALDDVCIFLGESDDSGVAVYECSRSVGMVKWYYPGSLPSLWPKDVELKDETEYRLAKYDSNDYLLSFEAADFQSLGAYLPTPVFDWESTVWAIRDLTVWHRELSRFPSLCAAVAQGSGKAIHYLGNVFFWGGCYFEWCGKSGERDFLKAYVWYEVAEENGYRSRDGRDAEAREHLSAREISQADVLIQNWTPAQCGQDLRRYLDTERARRVTGDTDAAAGAADASR